jgi:hypothetical protein
MNKLQNLTPLSPFALCKNGSFSCHNTTTTATLTHSHSLYNRMGRSKKRHSRDSSDTDSSSSRSRSRSRQSKRHRHRRHRFPSSSRSPSRSPAKSHSTKAKATTQTPYSAPIENGKCERCGLQAKFTIASERNKNHSKWPYWKCPKCQGKDSFVAWIHEGPFPDGATKGITFLGNPYPLSKSRPTKLSNTFPQLPLPLQPPTTPLPALWPLSSLSLQFPMTSSSKSPLQSSLPSKTAPILTQLAPPQPSQQLLLLLPKTTNQPALKPTPLQTVPKSPSQPKKEKSLPKKPCYHYNPHCNKDNKLKASSFNLFLFNSLARANKTPVTKTEKRLFRIRKNFEKNNEIKHTPSPHITKSVIYCIYNNKKQTNKLYIGQTVHTAYVRLQ